MKIKTFLVALSLCTAFASHSSLAGEASGENFLVLDNYAWPTGEKSGFYIFNGSGVSSIMSGPTETGAIECHGSGFWGGDGNRSEGICIHGSGDDTFTSTYKTESGAEKGHWTILSGTGKYAGISGSGVYVPNRLPGNRAVSSWQGDITLAE